MRRALVAIVAAGALSFVAPVVKASETPTSTISTSKMKVISTITGNIAPKSVASSGTGLVSAHNMMYRHSVTIYDAEDHPEPLQLRRAAVAFRRAGDDGAIDDAARSLGEVTRVEDPITASATAMATTAMATVSVWVMDTCQPPTP
jgi:hypothetical protein